MLDQLEPTIKPHIIPSIIPKGSGRLFPIPRFELSNWKILKTKSLEFIFSVYATKNSGSKFSKPDSHDESEIQMPIKVDLSEDQVNQQQPENAKIQFSNNVYIDLNCVCIESLTFLNVILILTII